MDGSSLGNPSPVGSRGLVKNPNGGCLFRLSGHIDILDVLKVEFLGIFNGLNLAWRRGFRYLICYTDSLNARNLMTEQFEVYHIYASMIQDIRDLMVLP